MSIEIVACEVCPRCNGTGKKAHYQKNHLYSTDPFTFCHDCDGTGTVPRTLATFADAAGMRDAINAAINRDLGLDSCEDDEWNNTSAEVLAALGVSDDQS